MELHHHLEREREREREREDLIAHREGNGSLNQNLDGWMGIRKRIALGISPGCCFWLFFFKCVN